MSSKVQRLVSQARATFSKQRADPAFSEELRRLKEEVNSFTSEDFNLTQSVTLKQWNYPPYVMNSPASCMEVYNCPEFSIGIFLIKPKKHMPFHDHPGMHGIMKVLFNSMTVTSYSKVDSDTPVKPGVPVTCAFLSREVLDPSSDPCILYPDAGNIHQIETNGEAVAFLDILAPPYDPDVGRDCNYYEKMGKGDEGDTSNVQLLPGPNPSWFSCIPLTYTGPRPS